MSGKTDILVLGATGFMGRLVTKQLNAHRDRMAFTFALGARSKTKLAALVSELDINAQVPLLIVDVTGADDVESVVKSSRVVINTVGPFWMWGTHVVRACARNGVHYVDISGENFWVRDLISEFDFLASKTHSVIVPACGFDSLPSDLSAYLSVRTLKDHLGSDTEVGKSVTAHEFRGGISGGTLSTMYTCVDPESQLREKFDEVQKDHALSPAAGAPSPPLRITYSLPHVSPTIWGGFFFMSPVNRSIVLRTRGLLEVHPSMRLVSYGPQFSYEEFVVTPSRFAGGLLSLGVYFITLSLLGSRIVRWLFKRFIVDQIHGPSDRAMETGFLKTTNVTSSIPSSTALETHAKSIIRVRGDPGYLCSAVMVTESAIALLDTSILTPLAREGGILTPVSAFGNEIVKRLEASGRFQFESTVLGN